MQLDNNSNPQLANMTPGVLRAVDMPAPETVSNDAPTPEVAAPPDAVMALNTYMMDKYGVDLDTAMSNFSQTQEALQQVQVDKQMQVLQQTWGVDAAGLSQRMNIVAAELGKLPEDQRALYDSLEGAQILWQRYTNQTGASANSAQQATPMDRNSGQTAPFGGSRYDFTRSQIYAMSDADLRKNDAAITASEASGRIYNDV